MAYAKYVGNAGGGGSGGWQGRGTGQVDREGADPLGGPVAGPPVTVRVQFGERHNAWAGDLVLARDASLAALKRKLARIHAIAPHLQRLRFAGPGGAALPDDDGLSLRAAGVHSGCKLLLVGHDGLFPTRAGAQAGEPPE